MGTKPRKSKKTTRRKGPSASVLGSSTATDSLCRRRFYFSPVFMQSSAPSIASTPPRMTGRGRHINAGALLIMRALN